MAILFHRSTRSATSNYRVDLVMMVSVTETDLMTFSQALRRHRRRCSLTRLSWPSGWQSAVIRGTRVPSQTESGHRDATISEVFDLARILGTSPAALVSDTSTLDQAKQNLLVVTEDWDNLGDTLRQVETDQSAVLAKVAETHRALKKELDALAGVIAQARLTAEATATRGDDVNIAGSRTRTAVGYRVVVDIAAEGEPRRQQTRTFPLRRDARRLAGRGDDRPEARYARRASQHDLRRPRGRVAGDQGAHDQGEHVERLHHGPQAPPERLRVQAAPERSPSATSRSWSPQW